MKTILLIEDNDDIRENTSEILELANYRTITAENGKVGVELAAKEKPDLIICDIMMPELDGYGVLFLLSKNPQTAGIPFIFLTAKSERKDFRKGMEMGADDYLTKPFDDIELLNAIEARLKRSESVKPVSSRNIEGINEFIREIRNFQDLQKVSEIKDIKKYKKKDMIFLEGNNPYVLYFINSGKVKTFRSNELGKELITSIYSSGDFLGYNALLRDSSYEESAMALEDCEIATISKQDFISLISNNREIAMKFIKLMSNSINQREEQLLALAYDSVRKRVAEALNYLANQYKENDQPISFAMSRENIASIAGTSTETLIRTLSDFKNEKLIDIADGKIMILNEKALKNMRN